MNPRILGTLVNSRVVGAKADTLYCVLVSVGKLPVTRVSQTGQVDVMESFLSYPSDRAMPAFKTSSYPVARQHHSGLLLHMNIGMMPNFQLPCSAPYSGSG